MGPLPNKAFTMVFFSVQAFSMCFFRMLVFSRLITRRPLRCILCFIGRANAAPGRQKIGTTSRGIGPAYEDKMHRSGLRVIDLLNTSILKKHIENACTEKNTIVKALFGSDPIDPDKMYEDYAAAAEPHPAVRGRYVCPAE